MIRLSIILALFSPLLLTGQKTAPENYPEYQLVAEKFYSKYSIKEYPEHSAARFEKRPTGWQVAILDHSNQSQVVDEFLFWSRKSGKFQKLKLPKVEDESENEKALQQSLASWGNRYYSICPFYGYPGWDMDMILHYGNLTTIQDTTRYALGRAYSSYASNLLNSNTGMAIPEKQFKLKDGPNSLSPEQLAEYRKYQHKAVEHFEILAQKNPDFKTIVGPIGVKASNERLTAYLDLSIYQNEEEAKKEIKSGLYSDFYISMAKNYLNSCAPNAILLTNGDNDTYPLLYVQAQYGIRTDVMVANLSLLNTNRYIEHLRRGVMDAPGLALNLKKEELEGTKRQVVMLKSESDEPMSADEALAFIRDDSHTIGEGSFKYAYLPTKQLYLNTPEGKINWEVDQRYFLRNHLILLDLLAQGNQNRPIYFGVTNNSKSFFGLDDYLKMEGMAYRLSHSKADIDDKQTGAVDLDVMYNNVTEKFDWNWETDFGINEKMMGMNYRYHFIRLSSELIAAEQDDKALEILDLSLAVLPDASMPYDVYQIPLIANYYRIGEFDKGNKVALKLIDNLNNSIDNFDDIPNKRPENYSQISKDQLRELAEKYDQQEVLSAL
ncbi:hypothetical protein KFE98_13335 [bacterium SCSIO 12741]|nr:hypothetical protein KFE98_13335 [bacterium SCSIO 12741]